MKRICLVDGNNLMYKIENCLHLIESDYPSACASLLNMIEQYSKNCEFDSFVVFFDGVVEAEFKIPENISIDWSMRKTADNRIMNYIRQNYTDKILALVTSDTELYNFGHFHSVKMITSGLFVNMMKKKRAEHLGIKTTTIEDKTATSVTRKNFSYYKKLFDNAGEISKEDLFQ